MKKQEKNLMLNAHEEDIISEASDEERLDSILNGSEFDQEQNKLGSSMMTPTYSTNQCITPLK